MIENYITYLRTCKGYSENTCTAYAKDLKAFSRWASENLENARWSQITRADIDNYLAYLVSIELKPSTTNRRLASISGLYDYFKRQGLEVTNPCRYESRRKVAKTVPNTIPLADLKSAYEGAVGVAKVMLGLLITTGIRIQELLDIKMEDINFEEASIRIHGKGAKERLVFTNPAQLETLQELKKMGKTSGIIFEIEQREARHIIFESLKGHSTACQLSPHAIRHTFATNLAKKGVNVSTLSHILGHEHLETTQRYIDLSQSDEKTVTLNFGILN